MESSYHYPADIFALLVDTIPVLCKSKKDMFVFFSGAGVHAADLAEMSDKVASDSGSVSKYEIARNVLQRANARGDAGLAARREIIKRVIEFEEFAMCWPNDQYKAKALVADIRKAVNAKDSFTRMKQDRDEAHEVVLNKAREEQAAIIARKKAIESVRTRLFALFGMDDQPQTRGKLLEEVLNDLFRAYGVLVKEDFRRKALDSSDVLEQIDGVIEFESHIYLVEMKWLREPVGIAQFAPHLVRLFGRANVRGIFISNSDYTGPVVTECASALNKQTIFLCTLKEIVMLLQSERDLVALLRAKARAAIVEKNPYLEVL